MLIRLARIVEEIRQTLLLLSLFDDVVLPNWSPAALWGTFFASVLLRLGAYILLRSVHSVCCNLHHGPIAGLQARFCVQVKSGFCIRSMLYALAGLATSVGICYISIRYWDFSVVPVDVRRSLCTHRNSLFNRVYAQNIAAAIDFFHVLVLTVGHQCLQGRIEWPSKLLRVSVFADDSIDVVGFGVSLLSYIHLFWLSGFQLSFLLVVLLCNTRSMCLLIAR